ncbi:MAG: efflux RND transporter permease subunit [Bacteroidota bacterium]
MTITNLAIGNRIAVIVLTLVLVIGGLLAYVNIPKEAEPEIEFATIVVTTIYPGASPDDIESIITQEIEREVVSVDGIDDLRSTSSEGVSTVVIEFTPDVDVDDAEIDVREAVDRAKVEFPSEVEEPIVSEIDTSEFPVITINLAADYSLAQLRDVAEDLQDEVESVPGILDVDLIGGLTREVQVNVDLAALQGYNLTFNDVIETIQGENTNIPGGSVDVSRLNYLVRVDGEFDSPEEIESLVIDAPGGRPIYVRDVAEARMGFKDRDSYARLQVLRTEVEDGEYVLNDDPQNLNVVSLSVKKRPGTNIIEVVDRVRETVAEFPMPGGTEITFTGDSSENVETLVSDLENNIISGLIFVVLVLLFFLGVRNATLVGLAIPFSMFLSFVIFAVMGQTLNFIILFSLIIALGMMVDNAVVIIENIYRYREMGYGRWEAARLGTSEVGMAVAASTATTVAAFAPMLFWPGIIGRFMSYMPLTLIVVLSASLFVALVINPVVTGYFMRLDGETKPKRSRQFRIGVTALIVFIAVVIGLANWKSLVFLAVTVPVLYYLHKFVLGPFSLRFQNQTVPRLTERYRVFLSWMLDRDYSAKRAMLRNTLALGSFTVGFLLLIGGALLGGVSQAASQLLLVPGMALLALGALGIVVHAIETIMLGRMGSVKAGLVFGAVIGTLCAFLWLGGRIETPLIVIELMLLPTVIVVFGLLGALVLGKRTRLLLTDNRARLLTATLASLIAIVAMFQVAPTGVEFFPPNDPNFIQVNVEAPLGTNIDASNAIADETYERIERVLAENADSEENVKTVLTQVGIGGDAQFGGGSSRPENSSITMTMKDFADRAEPSTMTLRKIREQLSGIPGTTFEVVKDQNGPPTGKPVNIEIAGENFDQIVVVSQAIKQRLIQGSLEINPETGETYLAGIVDIGDNLDTGRPEFQVDIDRERAAQFGLSTRQIAQTVRAAVNGIEASTFRTGEDEYDITVRLREQDRESLETLRSLTILYEGQQIPLVSVADISVGSGLGNITRLDQERVVTVSGGAAEGVNGNALLATVQGYLAPYVDNEVPPGITIRYTGESEDQAESFGFLTTALAIGLALITLILLLQFNSVGNTLIIMIATGLSLIGVMLGLILTRTPFGLMTFIGVISLAGIVVNNAIVLIDYIEQLRHKQGKEKQTAVIEGGATRLRPVLLTALTTVIGLVPLTFGLNIDFVGLITDLDPAFQLGSENTQFWGPMGTAIISGLTFSTFLTLVIVPVMYSTFDSIAARFGTSSDEATDTALHTDGALVPAPAGLRPTEGDGAGNGTVVRPTPSTS